MKSESGSVLHFVYLDSFTQYESEQMNDTMIRNES